MRASVKIWALRLVKIAIAVIGLWWVISHTPWNNVATLDNAAMGKLNVSLRGIEPLEPIEVTVLEKPVSPGAPDSTLPVRFSKKPAKVRIDGKETLAPVRFQRTDGTMTREIDLPKGYFIAIDNAAEPKIQVGLKNLLRNANPYMLLASWAVLCIPFVITAWRWKKLMEPQGIYLPYSKCLALTFVGQFYSTFLPGITGGDLVKIIYTAKVTGSKTKSTITILLDRVLGLVALLVIAGISAAIQAPGNPTMRNVALLIGAVLAGLVVGTMVYFSRRIRRALGIERLTENARERLATRAAARERGETVADEELYASKAAKIRKRLAEVVVQFDETLHVYRHHVGILALAFGVSLVTQLVMPLSAWMAGVAFGMTTPLGHYMAYVPLAILAASVPIAPPQGFGVTEYILYHFFHERGVETASRTFALAQAMRFLPLVWNLVGAYWVVTGSYSRRAAIKEGAGVETR